MGREMITLIVNALPHYNTFYYCRMGSFSLSTNAIKYIAVEDVIDYEDKQETSGYHYRRFLETQDIRFPKRFKASYHIAYPYFSKPTSVPSALYVDLRRAYRQIANAIGMEVWYKEGKSIGYGLSTPSTQLFEIDKVSRGLLVSGHYQKSQYTQWKNSTLTTVHFNNPHYAPFLQFAIWRILHAIMNKLKPFIFYGHTDGVIINHRMLPRVDKILTNYNFQYVIKDMGKATIKAPGTYKIGERETLNYNLNGIRAADYILSDEYDDWWLKVFAKGVEKRGQLDRLDNPNPSL